MSRLTNSPLLCTAGVKDRLVSDEAWAVGLLLLLTLAGCGIEGPERVVVTGEVTYQGQPLEKGQIRFVPAPGSKAPASGALVVDGRYTVDGKGGVPLGTHKITIKAYLLADVQDQPADSREQTPETTPPPQQYLPAKYNTKTELQITIPPGSRKITKDFKLTDY